MSVAISIQANIPPDLFDYLEAEKKRADEERRDVLVEFNGVQLHLKSHGGNGCRFIANGGPDGAHWFFKKPNAKDKWGIRVSFGSFFMAMYGLAAARFHLESVLERLGVRFGDADKELLKERWNIRTWAQLYARFGDLCRHSGEVVRYTDPGPSDPNRARWPNHLLWELVCAEMNDDLCEMRSGCDPDPIKEVHKETHISMMLRQLLGNAVTLAALNGKSQAELPDFLHRTASEMSQTVLENPEKTRKQLQNAKDRYVFIEPQRRAAG